MNIPQKMATSLQIKFLEALFIDCGYHSRKVRNAMLSHRTEREIKFLDELTMREASKIIYELKETKEDAKGRSQREVEDEE